MPVLVFVLGYAVIALAVLWFLPRSLDPLLRAAALLAPAIVLSIMLTPWTMRRR
jgi:hypothetical protein